MSTYAEAALDAAQGAGDPGLVARALADVATSQFFTGQRVDGNLLRQDLELEDSEQGTCRDSPSGTAALISLWSDDYAAARPALERAIGRGREQGEQYEFGALLFELGLLEWYAGNVEDAERHHAASREAMGDQDMVTANLWLSSGEAMFAARRGDLEHAREAALEAWRPTVTAPPR